MAVNNTALTCDHHRFTDKIELQTVVQWRFYIRAMGG